MIGVVFPDSISSLRARMPSRFLLGDDRRELLADEGTAGAPGELAVGASEPPAAAFAADDDEPAARGEGPPQA